jgi:hypothetical protein
MARITSSVIPIIQAAQGLAEQARDVLQLHHEEVSSSFTEVVANLEVAMEALDRAVDQLELR